MTTHWYRVFIKVGHVTHSFKRTKKTPTTVLESHDPSMYTLSMLIINSLDAADLMRVNPNLQGAQLNATFNWAPCS